MQELFAYWKLIDMNWSIQLNRLLHYLELIELTIYWYYFFD